MIKILNKIKQNHAKKTLENFTVYLHTINLLRAILNTIIDLLT